MEAAEQKYTECLEDLKEMKAGGGWSVMKKRSCVQLRKIKQLKTTRTLHLHQKDAVPFEAETVGRSNCSRRDCI